VSARLTPAGIETAADLIADLDQALGRPIAG
jgi:O-acetylhomoserine/O-acetylserine sulfhydrylase-like pyridoxal-dependent enzyme